MALFLHEGVSRALGTNGAHDGSRSDGQRDPDEPKIGTKWNQFGDRMAGKLLKGWWPGTDLNRRRRPFQGRALPLSYLANTISVTNDFLLPLQSPREKLNEARGNMSSRCWRSSSDDSSYSRPWRCPSRGKADRAQPLERGIPGTYSPPPNAPCG
jgi:hypothetical protein